MTGISDDKLLAEVEEIIRSAPGDDAFDLSHPDFAAWQGRAASAVQTWSPGHFSGWLVAVENVRKHGADARGDILALVYQAQANLRLRTGGPTSVAFAQGGTFDYFDEVRKLIEQASSDVMFVDPYLDADFVSTYLPHVKTGTSVRLLVKNRPQALAAAATLFTQQHGTTVEVRKASALHDRYLFVDRARCFTSGASFKDGAVNAGTTISEHVDAFASLHAHYDSLWMHATIHI